MDVATPINCQVGTFYICPITWALTCYNLKVLDLFCNREHPFLPLSSIRKCSSPYLFLDSFLRVCDNRFAIDCSSHVRLHLQLHTAAIFRNHVLIDTAISIAIWNKNRVVVILAIAVWGATIAFHLLSKSFPFIPSEHGQ